MTSMIMHLLFDLMAWMEDENRIYMHDDATTRHKPKDMQTQNTKTDSLAPLSSNIGNYSLILHFNWLA
jgi:hypothetical protein